MPIYLPETTDLQRRVADAASDRRRARQVRRRPGAGEARRRDRAAQPDAAAEAPARPGRGDRAEEHPDDRSDRRRQDRDRAAAGAAGAVAVHQGRGLEVHRGRLRRPRRRVDGARPDRARASTWCAKSASPRSARRRGRPPRSACSICCCRRCRRTPDYDEQAGDHPRAGAADAREAARAAARRPARSEAGRDRRPREELPVVRDHRRIVGRGSRHQRQGHAAGALPGPHEEAQAERAGGARRAGAGRGAEAGRHGHASRAPRSSACSSRASSSSTRSTRSPAARAAHGPDVSREGVQRDILPIVEGTTVNTKYGMVKTDHILFIAAGAFHVSKPSDLIPELQGRFPIRVELEALGREDFVRILTEPKSALVKQYTALLVDRGPDDPLHRGRDRPHRRLRRARERADGEHRRAAAAHGDGEAARRDLVRGAGHARQERRRSTRPTSTACSPTSSATKTCPATSCEGGRSVDSVAVASARWRPLPRAARRGRRSRRCGSCPRRHRSLAARRSGDEVRAAIRAAERERQRTRTGRSRRVEIYAVTVAPGAITPPNRDLLDDSACRRQHRRQAAAARGRATRAGDKRPAPAIASRSSKS